jgi:DNA invertase Pin-like site-specific DNA recombinase
LDRLGRDLKHLVTTAEDLRMRGVGLKVLAGAGAQIDTATANGKLAFIFAAFADYAERAVMRSRLAVASGRRAVHFRSAPHSHGGMRSSAYR